MSDFAALHFFDFVQVCEVQYILAPTRAQAFTIDIETVERWSRIVVRSIALVHYITMPIITTSL